MTSSLKQLDAGKRVPSWASISARVPSIAEDYLETVASCAEEISNSGHLILGSIEERMKQLLARLCALEGSDNIDFAQQALALCRLAVEDCNFAVEQDPAAREVGEVAHCYSGVRALFIYRLAHTLWKMGHGRTARCLASWAHDRFCVDIHPAARISAPCFLDHASGVVIGETADVGCRVVIYQGVTLGALQPRKEFAGKKRHPTILDGARLFAHCSILGGNTVIGRNVRVGLGVLVTESLSEDSMCSSPRTAESQI